MFRKRIVGGRGSLVGCALLIVVACGTGANETTSDPGDAIPGIANPATDKPSKSAAHGGTGAASTAKEDESGGGLGGAPSESNDGGPGIASNGQPTSNGEAKPGDGDATGEANDEDEPAVLALEDCDLAAPFDPPVAAFTGTTNAEGVTFSQDELTAYVSSKAASSSYDIHVATRTSTSVPFGALTSLGTSFNTFYDERSPSLSPDGLRLYLSQGLDVLVSTRTSLADSFSTHPPVSVGVPVPPVEAEPPPQARGQRRGAPSRRPRAPGTARGAPPPSNVLGAPRPVRIGGPGREELPGGDAVIQNGSQYLTPRGEKPARSDPVGDRLDQIAVETYREFNWTWLTPQQRDALSPWRYFFNRAEFQRLYKAFAGQAIEAEIFSRAMHDPQTRGLVNVATERPGPDFRQSVDSNTYYDVTTIRGLSSHIRREGMRPEKGTVRFILYPSIPDL